MQAQQHSSRVHDLETDARQRQLILALPVTSVIKPQYALALQQVLKLYTIGNLLGAWQRYDNQKCIEDLFDTPEQAHHAIATCAAWLGFQTVAAPKPVTAWWQQDDLSAPMAR